MTTTIASLSIGQSLSPSSSSNNSNDNLNNNTNNNSDDDNNNNNNNSPLIMDESHFIEWLKNNCPKLLSKALSEASSVLFNGSSLSFSVNNKSDIFASKSSSREKLTNSNNNFKHSIHLETTSIDDNKRFLMPTSMNQAKKSDDNFSTSSVSGNFHQPSHYHHHYYGPSSTAAVNVNVSKSNNVTVNGPVKNGNNGVVKTEKPLMMVDQQHHEYIMQSHSESARNAIIYVAVILSIYLMAIAAIAIQYYHKHQTLDPFSAYLLGQNGGSRVSKDRHNRRRYLRRSSASSSSNAIAIPVSGTQNSSANESNNSFNANNNKSMFHLNVTGAKESSIREKICHLQSSKRLLEQMQQENALGPFTTQSSSTTTLPTTITTTKLFNPADVHFAHYPAPSEHPNPNQQRNCHIFSRNNNKTNNNNNSFSQNQPIVVIEYGQQSSSTASSSFNNLYFDNTSDNESDLGNSGGGGGIGVGNGNDRAGGGCRRKTLEEPTVINNNTISGNGNKKPNVYGNVVGHDEQAMAIVEQNEHQNNGGNKIEQENPQQQQHQQQILINIETFDEVEKEKDNSCPKNEIKTTTGSVWIENINKQQQQQEQQKRQLLFKPNKDKKTKNLFPSSVVTDESSSSFIDEVSIENEEEEINSEDDEEEDDDDEENDDDEDEEYWIKRSGVARGQSKLKTTNLPPITSKLKNLFTFGLSAQFSATPMINQTSIVLPNTNDLVTTVPSILATEQHSKSIQENKPSKRRFLMRSLSLLTETSWPTTSRPPLVHEQSFDTVTGTTPTLKSPSKKNFRGKILFSFGNRSRQNPINSSQIITTTTTNTATSITKPKYEETHL